MLFWGAEVRPGQTVPFVPPPEGHRLHLSQVTLATWSGGDGPMQKAAVTCKTQDCNALRICTLLEGVHECHNLDLVFDRYTEFEASGAPVHLTGYHMPTHTDDEDEEDFEDMHPQQAAVLRQRIALQRLGGQFAAFDQDFDDDDDDEDDSDYESDSEEDDEEYDSDEDGPAQPSVVIEELTENGLHMDPSREAFNRATTSSRKDKRVHFPQGSLEAPSTSSPSAAAAKPAQSPSTPSANGAPAKAPNSAVASPAAGAAAPAPESAAKKKRKAKEDAGSTPAAKRPSGPASSAELQAKAEPAPTGKAAKKAAQQAAAAQTTPKGLDQPAAEAVAASKKPRERRFENGFVITDVSMGQPEGKVAKKGKTVKVFYKGRLAKNGKQFDQSDSKGFTFRLGVGSVIKGWDIGIDGMRVGDQRKLEIPPQLAYGSDGVRGAIPANASLIFDVKLLDVK
ncbi:hypothetical protein WJX73_001258 [Symbiochloris irregularis]|uniref:peptidylprolyl isomerase n=1 Tax=Symbiochloris irregularis TaxID=706552 RepID=A0AAW1NRY4_9CHLO